MKINILGLIMSLFIAQSAYSSGQEVTKHETSNSISYTKKGFLSCTQLLEGGTTICIRLNRHKYPFFGDKITHPHAFEVLKKEYEIQEAQKALAAAKSKEAQAAANSGADQAEYVSSAAGAGSGK